MARKISDREDLLVEGVNLPQRGRVTDESSGRDWIVGWRDPSALSMFDGADLVFQFNTSGRLRRVFMGGEKLTASAGQLARLMRLTDSSSRIIHEQHALSGSDTNAVLQRLTVSAGELGEALASGRARIETVGITQDVFNARLRSWLRDLGCVEIAHGPGVVG